MLNRFRIFTTFVVLSALALTESATFGSPAFSNELQTAMQSVVSVLPKWPEKFKALDEPEGTGVVIGNGNFVATARHVVDKALSVRIRTFSGEILPARIVGKDAHTDIAVLQISRQLIPIVYSEKEPELGQSVCGIGNAFGLGLSLSCGIVSGLNRSGVGFNRIEDFIQTDAAINPGASGGALVNLDGQFIGMISAIFTKKSDANIGINFAVSLRLMNRVVPELIEQGKVSWPHLGIVVSRIGKNRDLGELGARIVRVSPGSFADRIQIRPGDQILQVGSQRIRSGAELISLLSVLTYKRKVSVHLRRNGKIVVLQTPSY